MTDDYVASIPQVDFIKVPVATVQSNSVARKLLPEFFAFLMFEGAAEEAMNLYFGFQEIAR